MKHGLRSKYKGQVLGDRIQELIDDPDLDDIRIQLATLIALAEDLRERVEGAGRVNLLDRGAMTSLTVEITKVIERYHRITEGTKHTIRIEYIQVVVNQIVKVADDTIRDAKDRKRFLAGLDRLRVPDTAGLN